MLGGRWSEEVEKCSTAILVECKVGAERDNVLKVSDVDNLCNLYVPLQRLSP